MKLAYLLTAALAAATAGLGLLYLLTKEPTLELSLRPLVLVTGLSCAGALAVKLRELSTVRKKEETFPFFLRDLAAGIESGMTLPASLETCSKINYGPLTKDVEGAHYQVSWGVPFEDVMRALGDRSKSEHVKNMIAILIDANRSGGKIAETLAALSDYGFNYRAMKVERLRLTKPYTLMICTTFLIFIAIIVILCKTLFPALAKGAGIGGGGGGLEQLTSLLLQMVLIQAFFNGVVAGKMGEGSVIAGLKYSAVMLAIAILTFWLFL